MTLYLIGIGLWDEKDITLKGLEAVKKCDKVLLEGYTSKLGVGVGVDRLENLYGKKIILADRELVEKKAEEILEPAKKSNVALLVIGDVFGATTHTDLFLRAKQEQIDVQVINNASVLNAIGIVGLELYKYGKITSIPFHNADVEAPYDVIKQNKKNKLHTLCLLDIDAEHGKHMSIKEAVEYLLRVEAKRKEKIFTKDNMCIGVARLGSPEPKIVYAKAEDLLKIDFGEPLHSLIVPGELHFIEEDAIKQWA
ncbi:diphthine synthase [Candidatus Woesearchaeota archaeon]|nr:diphthine synthase [Candidatus Woesearchaeota archaeon]